MREGEKKNKEKKTRMNIVNFESSIAKHARTQVHRRREAIRVLCSNM